MSTFSHWIRALRPKTLPASIVPVVLGISAAYHDNAKLNVITTILTLLCGLGIQILTNFVNEIYDFKKGVDTDERKGPVRAVAKGIISIRQMTIASFAVGIVTLLLGLYLVYVSGYVILLVGIISLFLAYGYTAGPFPLSYLGIGDIFVLIFFGIVAVNGTYYIQTHAFSDEVFWMSLPIGFFAMNILGVNNIRDVKTDKRAKKITLPVRIGVKNAIFLYVGLTALAYFTGIFIIFLMHDYVYALPLLTLPLGIKLCIQIFRKHGEELNTVLAGTAMLTFFYGMLFSLSLVIKTVLRI